MPKKQQQEKSLSSFYFHFLQPGDAITGFLESAVAVPGRAGRAQTWPSSRNGCVGRTPDSFLASLVIRHPSAKPTVSSPQRGSYRLGIWSCCSHGPEFHSGNNGFAPFASRCSFLVQEMPRTETFPSGELAR